jgi:hypothetical protein
MKFPHIPHPRILERQKDGPKIVENEYSFMGMLPQCTNLGSKNSRLVDGLKRLPEVS